MITNALKWQQKPETRKKTSKYGTVKTDAHLCCIESINFWHLETGISAQQTTFHSSWVLLQKLHF